MILFFSSFVIFCLAIISLEDLFLDLYFHINKIYPRRLKFSQWKKMKLKKEKPIAIIIANWKEHQVIERMILGNLSRISYRNYHFFIGVYPNDDETQIAAKNVESRFPHNVHVIVNTEMGPTSKGQMLNQIVQGIFRYELVLKKQFEVFLMHDSEDIIHPMSLTVINSEMERNDFLQTPIFSFKRKFTDWVGSTYVDEFAELHTKDLLIRQALGAPIPSAGVGTAISRKLILFLMKENNQNFLREDSLTEDYVLGMTSVKHDFKSGFCCYYFKNKLNQYEYIATREYFPNKFLSAVKQKSRWVIGIVFQGTMMIEWAGKFINKYYLYRDRRGPIINFLSFASVLLTLIIIFEKYVLDNNIHFIDNIFFKIGLIYALIGLTNRFIHRVIAVVNVNGWSIEILQIPIRWQLGIIINLFSTIRAANQFQRFIFANEPLKWSKTTHDLPENFGINIQSDFQEGLRDKVNEEVTKDINNEITVKESHNANEK